VDTTTGAEREGRLTGLAWPSRRVSIATLLTFRLTNVHTASPPDLEPLPRASTPTAFTATLMGFVLLASVPTLWPDLDLWLASPFAGPARTWRSVDWWWVVLINDYVPALFRGLLMLAFAGWLGVSFSRRWPEWRLPLAFVVAAGILGPGAVVNLGFKEHWQRARPYQVDNFGGSQKFTRAAVMTDQCDNNCSFVSGHVACGAFLISLGLVHRRRARRWAVAGVLSGLVIGFARISDAAHWFSDVLWAFPITLCSSWVVWQGVQWLYRARPAESPSRTPG
jgi:lipid A 4'-phosphatase